MCILFVSKVANSATRWTFLPITIEQNKRTRVRFFENTKLNTNHYTDRVDTKTNTFSNPSCTPIIPYFIPIAGQWLKTKDLGLVYGSTIALVRIGQNCRGRCMGKLRPPEFSALKHTEKLWKKHMIVAKIASPSCGKGKLQRGSPQSWKNAADSSSGIVKLNQFCVAMY